MAEFIFETSTSIKGPWLLDSKQLGELEKILDEEWTRLRRRNEELIRVEVESRFKSDYRTTADALLDRQPSEDELRARKERIETDVRGSYKFAEKRSITIYLEEDKKLIVGSFAEAIRQQILLEETARAFEAVIDCGDIRCNFDLSRINGSLNLRVSPEELPEAREFFATLKTWSMASRPPKWLAAWSMISPMHWLL